MKNHLFIFTIFCFQLAYGQTAELPEIEKEVQSYCEGISPGTAIGIVRDGEIIYEKYFGYSNLEHRIWIDESTRFNIASNAKQYTALLILKLVQEDKLNLSDDFRKYLPDYLGNLEHKISIQHLLSHQSGIRDVYDLWALQGKTWWKQFLDNDDALNLLRTQNGLNFPPGSEYMYSNSNYILLAELISKISGTEFDQYARDLFSQLGMSNTSFLTNYMSVIPGKARPYANWNGWKEYPSITEIHGDGGLFTTLKDQLIWETTIQKNDGKSKHEAIVNQTQKPFSADIDNYGFGLMFGEYRGMNYAYHDGNTGAYNATFLRFPEERISIIVLSNSGNIPTNILAKKIADQIISPAKFSDEEYQVMPKTMEDMPDLEEIVGNYKTRNGSIIKIHYRDGDLYREIYQRDPVKLVHELKNIYRYESDKDLKIAFSKSAEGKQLFTIYYPGQEPNTGIKLPSSEYEQNYKASLNGKFYNSETDTEISIEHVEGESYLINKNGRVRKAELQLRDFLRMNSYEISIIRNMQGEVNGLNITNNRIKNVLFTKL